LYFNGILESYEVFSNESETELFIVDMGGTPSDHGFSDHTLQLGHDFATPGNAGKHFAGIDSSLIVGHGLEFEIGSGIFPLASGGEAAGGFAACP
jgi:hypothetical protein